MEVLTGAFSESFRTVLYPTLERLQDRLDEINDLATAVARLHRKVDEEKSTGKTARWRRMAAAEETQLRLARKAFWEKYGPSMLREIRAGFEALFGQASRPGSRAERDANP